MRQIIMALDQGTSSSRTILFNDRGKSLAQSSEPLVSKFPKSGWVEQDPDQIWETQRLTIQNALKRSGTHMKQIAGIGITNQRETVIAWDRETGKPVSNAIVWQCRRTADFCDQLKEEGFAPIIQKKTGLLIDAYFSGTKIRWMLQNVKAVRDLADQNRLAIGTVDSWLIWNLTRGKVHVTDVTNASRTMLYNILDHCWDEEILERFRIPKDCLPEVKSSSEVVGVTDKAEWGAEIPICGIAGDQQAALFGQACFDSGMAKNTYGTGAFLLMNAGNQPKTSESGLLTTIAWRLGNETTYALEGSVFIAGALVQWLRDQLGFFRVASETERMAELVESTGGVYVVPAFVGLGAPYWDSHARGTMVGLTRGTDRNHITRAALEAIAYQSYDMLKAMERDTGMALNFLRVDGGATENNFLCQFQSDILGLDVSRPETIETTALGAAYLAGLAVNVWTDLEQIKSMWREDRRFKPNMDPEISRSLISGWHRAVERAKGWVT